MAACPSRVTFQMRQRTSAVTFSLRQCAPAKLTRRPGDQFDTAIALIAIAAVKMSVIVSVILHGKIRRIDNRSQCYRTP